MQWWYDRRPGRHASFALALVRWPGRSPCTTRTSSLLWLWLWLGAHQDPRPVAPRRPATGARHAHVREGARTIILSGRRPTPTPQYPTHAALAWTGACKWPDALVVVEFRSAQRRMTPTRQSCRTPWRRGMSRPWDRTSISSYYDHDHARSTCICISIPCHASASRLAGECPRMPPRTRRARGHRLCAVFTVRVVNDRADYVWSALSSSGKLDRLPCI